jgi:5-methylcytosine-specific restriction endonuclease McrA
MKQSFICKNCNNSFEREIYPSSSNNYTFEFCSPSCRNKSRMIPLIPCPVCGTPFSPKYSKSKSGVRKYCSQDCSNSLLKGRECVNHLKYPEAITVFIKDNYADKGVDWIAERIDISKSSIKNIAHKARIRLNYNILVKSFDTLKENMTQEKNPNWKGGISTNEYGKNWDEQRKKALQRDDFTCQVCGVKNKNNHVHHITPRRLYKECIEDSNILSNLITLCPRHHNLVEYGKIDCPTVLFS